MAIESNAGNMSMSDVNLRVTTASTVPPPSYQSVFDTVKDAKNDSETFLDYLAEVIHILKKRIGVYPMLVIGILVGAAIFIFPLIEVIMGSLYLNDCKAQSNIPIYLIVVGIFVVAASTCCTTGSLRHRYAEGKGDEGDLMAHRCTRGCSLALYFICFILFIVGSAWVFGIGSVQFEDSTQGNYCHPSLYHFAYSTTILKWIVFILGAVGTTAFLVTLCCIFMVKESKNSARD